MLRRIILGIVVFGILVYAGTSHARQKGNIYLEGFGGPAIYAKDNGDMVSNLAAGGLVGYHASDQVGLEFRFEYMDVDESRFYMPQIGGSFFFDMLDLFAVPYVGLHLGVLIPTGKKTDADAMLSFDAGLRYMTSYNIYFGPMVGSHLVLEGSHRSFISRGFFELGLKF